MPAALATVGPSALHGGQKCPIVRLSPDGRVRALKDDHVHASRRAVRGNEFLRRIRELCRERRLNFEWHPDLGKGSHGVLVVGARRTVLRNLRDELKTGTLHAMLKQLGLDRNDI